MKSLKKAAEKLCDTAIGEGVKFPERWRRPMILRACSSTLMLNSSPDSFDFDSALSYLKKKYGVGDTSGVDDSDGSDDSTSKEPIHRRGTKSSRGTTKAKKPRTKGAEDEGVVSGGGNKDTSPDFHPKKYVEENRPLAEAVKEMGAVHFRHNEPKKGVAYMNAVKSIRQCKHRINNMEDALALPNVGPHVAKYVDEFIKTGDVKHWEELRSSLPPNGVMYGVYVFVNGKTSNFPMSNPKEVAQNLFKSAVERRVRFPKIWDEVKSVQACGTTLMLHRNGSQFDEAAALEELISKYGTEEPEVKPESPSKKKRKLEGEDQNSKAEVSSPSSAAKKPKKTDIVTVEGNRAAAEAIKEMADIYFKNKDNRKGGVFSKGAKAIREADFLITDKKAAMKLPGVGKGIAGYIEELKDSGSIRQLEELRAGTA